MPNSAPGVTICSPSALEVTSRLDRLLRYTTLCPPSTNPSKSRLHTISVKQREAESIIAQFRFQPEANTSGITFLDPNHNLQSRTGVFSGDPVGQITAIRFEDRPGLLHDYDQRLRGMDLPIFAAEESWNSRIDYCIFSCHTNR